ncbi:hypothetical protein [Gordonia rhizosphera]|nr:hypothetical protein [Gordonia rhizosphera]
MAQHPSAEPHPAFDDEAAAAAHRRQIRVYLGITLSLIGLLIALVLSM